MPLKKFLDERLKFRTFARIDRFAIRDRTQKFPSHDLSSAIEDVIALFDPRHERAHIRAAEAFGATQVPCQAVGIDAPDALDPLIDGFRRNVLRLRSEEHTSELQSLMRISYAVFCLKK